MAACPSSGNQRLMSERRSRTRKPRRQGRRPATRESLPRVRILCEAAKTEPGYFSALARDFDLPNVSIRSPKRGQWGRAGITTTIRQESERIPIWTKSGASSTTTNETRKSKTFVPGSNSNQAGRQALRRSARPSRHPASSTGFCSPVPRLPGVAGLLGARASSPRAHSWRGHALVVFTPLAVRQAAPAVPWRGGLADTNRSRAGSPRSQEVVLSKTPGPNLSFVRSQDRGWTGSPSS